MNDYRGLTAINTDNEDEDTPPQFISTDQEKIKWSHIEDLDEFFNRVYQYHQNHGMPSLVFMELLNLFQIVFLACFSVFMLDCVNYEILFQSQRVTNDRHNDTVVKKATLSDVVFPMNVCVKRISFALWLCLAVVLIFWIFRLIKAFYNILRYAEIRSFYSKALKIETKDLPNITWHEVQEKLLHIQKEHHLCVHKQELTELDIYNRILRFKNYEVAMVNQGVLPPKLNCPFVGETICFSTGFKYNFEFLFFWGPFAPFTNCYQLRPEFKVYSKRADLTSEVSKCILVLGLLNLILAPAIFVWQLLQFLYNYTELIKREPGMLGIRRWSNYGKLYLRHFNELDHELEARLSRAYKPATLYLSSFVSRFVVVIAKFVLFTFGAVFAVLVVLTIYDEDVINVEHVLTIISISGAVAGIARSLIPDETTVYFMDQMMYQILAQIHYMPDSWKSHANSNIVRDDFIKLFQFKFVYLIEELFSPLMTPFILLFWLRPRASKIVDFMRNFTVDVVGVGDVCSFAQMDTRRHGNPKWMSKVATKKKSYQAQNGKTELSLIHFTHTNPHWRMPAESNAFFDNIKDQALSDITEVDDQLKKSTINSQPSSNSIINNPSLTKSLYHLQSLVYNSTLPSNLLKSNMNMLSTSQFQQPAPMDPQSFGQQPRGGVSRIEGPLFTNKQERQTLLAIAQASSLQLSTQTLLPVPTPNITTALESSLDMCFSALYMHELHRKYNHGDYIDLDRVKEEEPEDEEADNADVTLNNVIYQNNTYDDEDNDYDQSANDSDNNMHNPNNIDHPLKNLKNLSSTIEL